MYLSTPRCPTMEPTSYRCAATIQHHGIVKSNTNRALSALVGVSAWLVHDDHSFQVGADY